MRNDIIFLGMEGTILRVALIVPPGFAMMSFQPLSVFETVNQMLGNDLYEIHLLSEQGGLVRNSIGMEVSTRHIDYEYFDTIIVGSAPSISVTTPVILNFLRHATDNCRRMASICAGVFTLAESGVLDGRRVTTHWALSQELQDRFPNIKVEPDRIFVADEPFWTSAGMTAGIDLALSLVERDVGFDIANDTAKKLVVHHRRAGGQSQHSMMLELSAKSDRVQDVLAYVREHLPETLSVERLAEVARLSPRQFSRIFRIETGQSPARTVESFRLEAARLMLEQGRIPVEEIAQTCGFGNRERMRRGFQRTMKQTPQAIRNSQHPLASL